MQISADEELPPDQVNPVSTKQDELHPSPLNVFPSSHFELPEAYRFPSPHILHVELHPSPFIEFPSSQYVDRELNRLPSPQISFQLSFDVDDPPEQIHPVSTLHDEFHPSPPIVFPSSQNVARDE